MKIDISNYSSGIGVAIVFALAGLGMFLVAVKIMSSSMKTISSGFMTNLLKKLSTNRWVSLLFGVVFTTMIQSSDGAVALAIGLIGAGLLTLRAAIPFILGANIGTATTALIVALGGASGKAFEFIEYFPLLVFFGAAILLFVKEERKTNVAMLVFAIGAIFLGLKVMGAGMHQITSQGWFNSFVKGVGINPWVAMISNTAFTGVVQSSSATVTVVQSIYSVNEQGISNMSLASAIAMVIGANIGTTFTALITSIGGPKDAKRIAVIWLLTNSIMALIVMPLIYYYADLIHKIQPLPAIEYDASHNVTNAKEIASIQKFQLAWAHLLFNAFLVSVFIWLVSPLEKFTKWVIKDKESTFKYDAHLPIELLNSSPDLAMVAANKVTNVLGRMSQDYLTLVQEYIKTGDKNIFEEMLTLKGLIETTRKALYAYLVEIGSRDISKKTSTKHMSIVLAARSLERIPILARNLATELANTKTKNGFDLSEQSLSELLSLFQIVRKMTEKASKQLNRWSITRNQEIIDLNEYVDAMVENFSANYIQRNERDHVFDYLLALKSIGRMSHHANRVSKYINYSNTNLEVKDLSEKLEKEILKELS